MDQSIFYVDIENLQGIAKQALTTTLENWPEGFPKPAAVNLYVKADQTEMWNIWASHHLPEFRVNVKGVQHYTSSGSKNSADLFLALEALSDLFKGRTKHIAVMSDDSDYASLFAAVKREISSAENPKPLFKWFMTNRADTRSQVLNDFFPSEFICTVDCSSSPVPEAEHAQEESPHKAQKPFSPSAREEIAITIIRKTPLGSFKTKDCRRIIEREFPKHPILKADSAVFGARFANEIWPVLEKFGVQMPNANARPRRYEMTKEAKRTAERPE